MRLACLLIIALIWMQPSGLRAQVTVLRDAALPGQPAEIDRLRAELAGTKGTKNAAAQDKARAYREAHILYRNCAKELRAFCMLSAQTLMRDADFLYKYREEREFSNIAALEQAIADLESKARAVVPAE